jgi:Holliday junction resolvasome RuvABC endonuclease subunit
VIKKLAPPPPERIIGIDASTHSIAFAIFEKGKPLQCGEIELKGHSLYDRLYDGKKKVQALVSAGVLVGDLVAIEAAWTGNNPRTGLDLSLMYGAIIGELMVSSPDIHRVAPITWQSHIGNPNLKKHEKEKIANDLHSTSPSKSALQVAGREFRKQRTLKFARKYFDIPSGSDNIGDAVGVAIYAQEVLTKQN